MQAEKLSLSYGNDQVVLEGASFSIQKKERCGLIGRNGSGKSTLFRLITGKETPDSGRIILPKGYKIGVLEQHIQFTKKTILEEAAKGLENPEELYLVESLLLGLGFSVEDFEKSPLTLSGGYALRVQLAKVLVSNPDCLLLDEPTNYLDIVSIRFLTQFLKNWPNEMILISHDLQFLDETTTHMMGIHRHKIYKIKGKSNDLFHMIVEEEERHEKVRQNLEKQKAHLQSFIDRFGAKATKAKQAQARKKRIDKLPDLEKLKTLSHLDFTFHEAPFMGRKILEAKEISFSYGDKPLIQNFSLLIEKGDRIAIIGKNGYGKSTLLQLLSKDLTLQKGELFQSEVLQLGFFGQTHIDRLNRNLTIEEEISSSNPSLSFTQIRAICGLMMFSKDLAEKPISVLSGGERSRVLLGKIVAKPCNLLLLDEPTHHLDIESIEALIDAIEEFSQAVVIVTHSEWILRRLQLNKIVVCHQQEQMIFEGDYDEFLEKIGWQEEEKETKKIKKAAPSQLVKKELSRSEIASLEEKIGNLEKKLQTYQEKLIFVSSSPIPDYEEIKKIGFEIEKIEQGIDECYKKLG